MFNPRRGRLPVLVLVLALVPAFLLSMTAYGGEETEKKKVDARELKILLKQAVRSGDESNLVELLKRHYPG